MRTVMNDHVRARTDSRRPRPARRALLCCAVLLSLAAPAGAMAAETTMVKLIKGLIASGALKPEDGQALLVQAEAEAAAAQRCSHRDLGRQWWRGPGGRRRARALRAAERARRHP
jgi:hypothetical protein